MVFKRYDALVQDEDGVWMSPGGARVAWFSDPDGNTSLASAGARELSGPQGVAGRGLCRLRGASQRRGAGVGARTASLSPAPTGTMAWVSSP